MPSALQLVRAAARAAHGVLDAAGEGARALLRPMSGRVRVEPDSAGPTSLPAEEPVGFPTIVLDGVFFGLHSTGIARVWRSLMAEWSENGFAQHVVVLDRDGRAPRLPGFTYRRTPRLRRFDSFAQRITLESACRAERADLFVSTYYSLPLSTRTLQYVYDMIPESVGFDLRDRVWREKRRAIRHASAFVAISESTARDLHRFYPETQAVPLEVALNAADPIFKPAAEQEIAELLRQLDLPREYFLFIGARDVAYKNASLVFDAIAILPDSERPAMLFVGGSPTLEASFAAFAERGVVRVAALADDDLRIAYSGALGLIYPSKYEGFGIPILEAMACGCPVVTCNNSSMPEVAGEAAIYVSDDDASELAAAMTRLRDPEVRDRCRRRGFERAGQFNWGRTADTVESLIRQVLEKS